jgi:hypothetical protein
MKAKASSIGFRIGSASRLFDQVLAKSSNQSQFPASRMKQLVALFLFALLSTIPAIEIDGYEKVEVLEVLPGGLKIRHSGGVKIIPRERLPEAVQKEFGLTEERKKEADRKATLEKDKVNFFKELYDKSVSIEEINVISIVDETTIQVSRIKGFYHKWQLPNSKLGSYERVEGLWRDLIRDDNAFINVRSTSGYVTGKTYPLNSVCFPVGVKQYKSVSGSTLAAPVYESRSEVVLKGIITRVEANRMHQVKENLYTAAYEEAVKAWETKRDQR